MSESTARVRESIVTRIPSRDDFVDEGYHLVCTTWALTFSTRAMVRDVHPDEATLFPAGRLVATSLRLPIRSPSRYSILRLVTDPTEVRYA